MMYFHISCNTIFKGLRGLLISQIRYLYEVDELLESKGGGTGGARGAIAPPLFTDYFKNDILFDYSDTENCY